MVAGKNRPLGVDGEAIMIGRSRSADFRINHPSVSRTHAKVVRSGGSASNPIVTLTDLGSTLGTYLNDDLITGEVQLMDGDTIRIGDIFLRFVVLQREDDLEDFLTDSSRFGVPSVYDREPRSGEETTTQASTSASKQALVGVPSVYDKDEPDEPTTSHEFGPQPNPKLKRGSVPFQLECVRCGARRPGRFDTLCSCGGMLDAVYDLAAAELVESENPFLRFGDLLPVHDRSMYPSTARRTPCIHATRLGELIGLPWLYLKNETRHPTGTTKDRASIIVLAMLLTSGVTRFVTASTGNAGSGYAFALQTMPQFSEMEMHLFVGEDFHGRSHYGGGRVKVFAVRRGNFEDATALCAAYAKQMKMISDGGFFSPPKREGAKLAYFEATEQIERPIDWYVQAVSSGLGVYGTFKGAKELAAMGHIHRLPRLLCVQEDTCAPQVRAWNEGCETIKPEHIVHDPHGIALAIQRGDPSRAYPYMRSIVMESCGTFTAVSESEIREARDMLHKLQGIEVCFNSAAALAGVIKEARNGILRSEETVLINLTGSDRTPDTATKDMVWLDYDVTDRAWKTADGSLSISEESAFKRLHDRRRSDFPR
jgi:threonine synthase